MTSTSEYIRSLAGKTPEEIQAIADECAEEEARLEKECQERLDRGFDSESEINLLAWSIKRWVKDGADMKAVQKVLSAAFTKSFASQGYVLKAKVEKLF